VSEQIVGVVPGAGRARRLGSPASSKGLERVYLDPADPAGARLPVCYRLLHGLAEAGIPTAIVVTLAEKSDLRDFLGDGGSRTPALRHVQLVDSPSPVVSIAAATSLVPNATIALGFPDVLWKATAPFARLLARLDAGAVIALGLFPPSPDYATSGVLLDGSGRISGFLAPDAAAENPQWTLAVWRPVFSRMIEGLAHDFELAPRRPELGMTGVIEFALERGLRVDGVVLSDEPFFDIGAPDRLEAALRRARPDRESPP